MLHRILLVAAALTLLPRASAAQGSLQDVPAERLRPAIDRNGIIDVESGSVGSHLDFDAALWLGYALNPLVLYQDTGDGDERVGALVQHRLGANFVGALSLVDWLQIGIDLPVVLYQGADQDAVDLLGDTAPDAAGFGDLRLVPKVRLLHAAQHGINLALMPIVTLPTGFPGANHLGEESFTASPELAASRHFGPLRAGLNVGYRWREKTRLLSLRLDDEITYRIGAAIDLEPWAKVPAQAAASIGGGLSARAPFEHQNRSPLEMLLSGLWEVTEDLQVFVGTGFGLVSGYATPDLRLFGGVRFSPRTFDRDGDGIPDELDACSTRAEDKDGYNDEDGCPDPDNDGDGLLDEADSCPTRAEDIDSFEDDDGCPDEDNDADGIADENDDCPMAAEDEDGFEDDDGCPEADNDADGIEDAEDQCPLEAEDKDGFEDEDGCPDPDNDRDGIEDERDQCPNEAEVINGVEDEDGCPDEGESKVKVTETQIEISEKIYFDTGRARIKERSHNVLRQVASILKANPQITKLRIEGHTDSRGSTEVNQALSQARAEAVEQFLVEAGVDAAVLEAKGYGESRPIASNDTAQGRELNRRVEFTIVEVDGRAVGSPVPEGEQQ